jgi:hypothetical protein
MSRPFHWLNEHLEARPVAGGGKGVFTRASLASGTRLAIFGGHVMAVVEGTLYLESGLDLSIQIDETHTIGISDHEQIEDADHVNHSCEPNAGIKGQIILVAMRDIAAGEEITFDYATVLCGEAHPILDSYFFACCCGSPGCRRTITAHDWKRPDLRTKYRGWFSWYLQEKIDLEGK